MAAFAISKQKNLMTIVDFLCMRDNRPVFLNSKFRWQLNFSNGSSETVSARNVLFSGVFIWVLFDEHFSLNKISRIISDAFRYGFQMNHTVRFESQLTVHKTTLNGRILGCMFWKRLFSTLKFRVIDSFNSKANYPLIRAFGGFNSPSFGYNSQSSIACSSWRCALENLEALATKSLRAQRSRPAWHWYSKNFKFKSFRLQVLDWKLKHSNVITSNAV